MDDIEKQDKANFQAQLPDPSIGSAPLAQPDLYQDSGGGYNVDFVDPQD